jgi:hypothetical protein
LSILYGSNPKLLHLLINPDTPRLISSSENIKYNSGVLSSSEQLLICIGLDAWDRSGGIHFNDLYQCLDNTNFNNMLLALLTLRNNRKKAILF